MLEETNGNEENNIKSVVEVLQEYMPRFNNIAWDTKFLALAITKVDLQKFFEDIEDETVRNSYFAAIERMVQPGSEGYTIFKFSLTFYWAEIESFMDAFLKSWLTHQAPPSTLPIFEKISFTQSVREFEQLSVRGFEQLSRSEVMTLYVQSLKVKVRKGSEIKTFFAALDNVGLDKCDGKEKKRLERVITELQQIRNVMVHKSGIVDKRMITACPWLEMNPKVEIDKLYPLNIEVMQSHASNSFAFLQHVTNRLERYFPEDN
jgi:hypothetical protein